MREAARLTTTCDSSRAWLLMLTGRVSLEKSKRNRGYALIFAFVVATATTPSSDVISMSMMAVSMYLLYELSLFSARFFLKM
jgi:sec-independent protein translocase protein TatC